MKLDATKVGGVFVFADGCRVKLRHHAAKAAWSFNFNLTTVIAYAATPPASAVWRFNFSLIRKKKAEIETPRD